MLSASALKGAGRTLISRRPAVPVAVAFAAGIFAEQALPCWPVLWIGLIALLVGLTVVAFRKSFLTSLLLLIALFLMGLVAAEMETNYFTHRDIAHFTTDTSRLAQLELFIESPPRLQSETGFARPLPPKQIAHASVTKVRTNAGWEPACGQIVLTVDQPHPELAVGQTVLATGMLQRPMPAANPGQFNWAEFYRHDRVLTLLNVPHADAVQIIGVRSFQPLEALRTKARQLLADGFPAGEARDYALLQALTLGDREASMRDAQDDFARSGTAHLLAVSGLHVVLVGAAALLLLGRLLGLHPRTATLAAMVVVFLYAFAVVPGTPAVRATVLCLAYGINRLVRQRPDGLQLLALCAIGLLIWHPHDLLSSGFQLSFLTVAGMIIAGRRVAEFLHDLIEDEHTRVARSFRPPAFWGGVALACRRKLIDVVAMSLVAWAVSLPLVMHHFEQANPWAILGGLIALLVVIWGLMAGLLKILLTLALPSFAGTWATMAGWPMVVLRHTVHWLASWPGANLPAPSLPVWHIVVVYALLALPLLPWTWTFAKRWLRCAPAAACVVALLPILGASKTPATADVRVTLLAIGAGQIGIIELPGHRVVLIDDGSSSVPDPLHQCLGPYLRTRGVRTIEAIILSHPDFDHISAAADTAEVFHTGRVMINPVFRGQSIGNAPAEAMLERFAESNVPVEIISRGKHLSLGDDAAIDVLWPPADRRFTSTNNAGLVLRLSSHGRTVLFPADIQVPTERELVMQPELLQSDVLVAPHHGSAEISTADFVAAVHPIEVLSSNDRRLSKKQREFDHLVGDLPLFRTSRYGAVTVCISKAGEIRIETFLHPKGSGQFEVGSGQ